MSEDRQISADAKGRGRSLYGDMGGKRLLDLVGALALLGVTAPLILALWLAIRRNGGPGFYAATRIGRGGRPFHCWKLRTMHVDAQEVLAAHLATDARARAEWDATRKLREDPRITPLGAVLRRYSLDELPQFWNVLRGDMSLVGPRPVPSVELADYGPAGRRAYEGVRPGITGLWQVSGRNAVSYERRIELDRLYCARISLLGDLGILIRTIRVVIGANGL